MKVNILTRMWVAKNGLKVCKFDLIYAKLWVTDFSFSSMRAETVFSFIVISPIPDRLLSGNNNNNNNDNNNKVIRVANIY